MVAYLQLEEATVLIGGALLSRLRLLSVREGGVKCLLHTGEPITDSRQCGHS